MNGTVLELLPDGAGGVYVGGSFTAIGGVPRTDLADVLLGGAVDPAYGPATDGANLFVPGRFTEVGRAFDDSVASLDPATGAAHEPFRFFADKDA
ncbi:MAG: hypothetical protein ACR2KV_06130 [Solirubrobacteraceae bacterium]